MMVLIHVIGQFEVQLYDFVLTFAHIFLAYQSKQQIDYMNTQQQNMMPLVGLKEIYRNDSCVLFAHAIQNKLRLQLYTRIHLKTCLMYKAQLTELRMGNASQINWSEILQMLIYQQQIEVIQEENKMFVRVSNLQKSLNIKIELRIIGKRGNPFIAEIQTLELLRELPLCCHDHASESIDQQYQQDINDKQLPQSQSQQNQEDNDYNQNCQSQLNKLKGVMFKQATLIGNYFSESSDLIVCDIPAISAISSVQDLSSSVEISNPFIFDYNFFNNNHICVLALNQIISPQPQNQLYSGLDSQIGQPPRQISVESIITSVFQKCMCQTHSVSQNKSPDEKQNSIYQIVEDRKQPVPGWTYTCTNGCVAYHFQTAFSKFKLVAKNKTNLSEPESVLVEGIGIAITKKTCLQNGQSDYQNLIRVLNNGHIEKAGYLNQICREQCVFNQGSIITIKYNREKDNDKKNGVFSVKVDDQKEFTCDVPMLENTAHISIYVKKKYGLEILEFDQD